MAKGMSVPTSGIKQRPTVFSHIIQKRFAQEYENVATEALSYILETSDAARRGMTKLLRGIIPELPALRFDTQQAEGTQQDEGNFRPDMRGCADLEVRVFV